MFNRGLPSSQAKKINESKHLVLKGAHPSPLSASKGSNISFIVLPLSFFLSGTRRWTSSLSQHLSFSYCHQPLLSFLPFPLPLLASLAHPSLSLVISRSLYPYPNLSFRHQDSSGASTFPSATRSWQSTTPLSLTGRCNNCCY